VSINFRPLMQYIYCKPSPQLSGMLNTEQGFTISFLIRRSGDLLKPQVYLAFGGKNQPPVCKFEKLWWWVCSFCCLAVDGDHPWCIFAFFWSISLKTWGWSCLQVVMLVFRQALHTIVRSDKHVYPTNLRNTPNSNPGFKMYMRKTLVMSMDHSYA